MALLGQGGVADARVVGPVLLLQESLGSVKLPLPVGVIDDVVEIGQALFPGELAEGVHVAVGLGTAVKM